MNFIFYIIINLSLSFPILITISISSELSFKSYSILNNFDSIIIFPKKTQQHYKPPALLSLKISINFFTYHKLNCMIKKFTKLIIPL